MRAVVFHEHGDVENLRVDDIEEPSLREGDALIEVGATSINGFDPQIVAGTTGLLTPLPMISCGDPERIGTSNCLTSGSYLPSQIPPLSGTPSHPARTD